MAATLHQQPNLDGPARPRTRLGSTINHSINQSINQSVAPSNLHVVVPMSWNVSRPAALASTRPSWSRAGAAQQRQQQQQQQQQLALSFGKLSTACLAQHDGLAASRPQAMARAKVRAKYAAGTSQLPSCPAAIASAGARAVPVNGLASAQHLNAPAK